MRSQSFITLALVLASAACGGATGSSSSASSNDGGLDPNQDGGTIDPGAFMHVDAPLVGQLYDIWGSAANDAWITGDDGLLHWDGKSWTKYTDASTSALSGSTFGVVTGTSASDVWIMGGTPASPFVPVFSHFDGTSWSAPTHGDAKHGQIYGGWATSANDVWAVGRDDGQSAAFVMHYDGKAWTLVRTDAATDLYSSVWASNANDVWVAGHGGILHYDGKSWVAAGVQGNAPRSIGKLHGTAHDDVWAVGLDANAFNPSLLHFDGTTWSVAHAGAKNEDFIGVFSPNRGTAITLGSSGIDDSRANALIGVANGTAWGSETVAPPGGANLGQLTRAWGASTGGTWIIGDEILHRN